MARITIEFASYNFYTKVLIVSLPILTVSVEDTGKLAAVHK